MRYTPPGLRFHTPLRLQGRHCVRVVRGADEDWRDEAWDPLVRDRLRLIGQALQAAIDRACHDGGARGGARTVLAETCIEPAGLMPSRRRCAGAH